MSQQDKVHWLVKSSGRVVGPYSLIKIKELLRTKELVAHDEVSLPFKRWKYIREMGEFQEVIEEVRERDLKAGEDTISSTGQVDELTASVTEAAQSIDDDLTGEVDPIDSEMTQNIYQEEAPHQHQTEGEKVVRYGTAQAAEAEVRKSSQWGWVLALLVVVGAGSYIGFKKAIVKPKSLDEQFVDSRNMGGIYLRRGNYESALESFQKAYDIKPEARDIFLPLGALQVKISEETVSGKRLLRQVLDYDRDLRKHAWTAIGLADLIEGNESSAISNFDRALKDDPKFSSAIINKGIIDYQKRRFRQAGVKLNQVIRAGSNEDNSPYILLGLNHLKEYEFSKSINNLKSAKRLLSKFVKRNLDYRLEGFFLLAYIAYIERDVKQLNSIIKKTIDSDPQLTERYRHDLYLYTRPLQWGEFLGWCDQIYEKYKSETLVPSFHAFCLMKAGMLKEAESRMVEALDKLPNHPLVNGLQSYLLQLQGRESEATIALGRAIEFNKGTNKFYQPFLLQAWYCQENNDFDCAKKNWFRIQEINPSDLQAKVNVAIIRSNSGGRLPEREASSLKDRYGNYIPLRRLMDIYGGFDN